MPKFKKGSAAAKAYMAKIRAARGKKVSGEKKPSAKYVNIFGQRVKVGTKKYEIMMQQKNQFDDLKKFEVSGIKKINGFENTYKNAPSDVKKILDGLDFMEDYGKLEKAKKALMKKGYYLDYGLDGAVTEFRKVRTSKKIGYRVDRTTILTRATPLIKKYQEKGYTRPEAIKAANLDVAQKMNSTLFGTKNTPESTHKDTKSHNVNIRVVSGVKQLSGVAPHKAKYFIDFIYQGIERTEYFDKLPADRYKGMNGIIYVTRLTDYGTTLIPLTETKTNKPLKK
jgi:hypothetical protein